MHTPWGTSQHQHRIDAGVWEVDTAGHGGILVSKNAAKRLLSPEAIELGWKWLQWYAYEEDCGWAVFAFEQPELYTACRTRQGCTPRTAEETRREARETLAEYFPAYLAMVEKNLPSVETSASE
jgi:hypothetical protein